MAPRRGGRAWARDRAALLLRSCCLRCLGRHPLARRWPMRGRRAAQCFECMRFAARPRSQGRSEAGLVLGRCLPRSAASVFAPVTRCSRRSGSSAAISTTRVRACAGIASKAAMCRRTRQCTALPTSAPSTAGARKGWSPRSGRCGSLRGRARLGALATQERSSARGAHLRRQGQPWPRSPLSAPRHRVRRRPDRQPLPSRW